MNNAPDRDNKDAQPRPDPETLNTTDPQENMEGPISSLVNDAGDKLETNEEKGKEEADAEKDRKM